MKEKNDNQEFKQFEKIEDIFPAIKDYIEQLILDYNFDSKNIYNNNWDFILQSIYMNILKPNEQLYLSNNPKMTGQLNYNKDSIYKLYDFYTTICRLYNKPIRIKSFLLLTNMNKGTLTNLNLGELLNDNNATFHKKIKEDSEQSLVGLMQDRGNNAIAYISELNTRFGWNSVNGHSTIEDRAQRTALSDARSEFELFENDTQLLEDDNLE